MPTNKPKTPQTGRKSAYVARNRAAILRAALAVFARDGVDATMEDVADEAQVAMSTVYKHFKDKRDLITATTTLAFEDWESWVAQQVVQISDPLEQLVMPMRLFLRAKQTHPEYAQLVAKNFGVVTQILPELTGAFTAQVNALNKAKVLNVENTVIAINNLISVVVIQLVNQTLNPKATAAEGDSAIRIALTMLGISDAKAKKLTESKIVL
ncbi:MAG: TetR/AcrR family transcriptional regulator [Candidatus Nanopelagicus sp.]